MDKISFGFKFIKKPSLLINKKPEKEENKVELIKCLEGQEIKLVVEKPAEQALIIPLKENQKTSAALASLITRRAVLFGEDELEPEPSALSTTSAITEIKNGNVENLEDRAARELLSEVTKASNDSLEGDKLVLPVVKPDDLPLNGAKQSSLDDYESIPVQQFGMAMLRGMGWIEPPKKKGVPVDDLASMLRPKGMGLGADKALKPKPLLVQPEKNEILEIKRQAYVRILAGRHKDMYGQIEGFDDHAGRVIVKMAIGSAMEVFNEFMCQPVSKKEFSEYGKCINTAKYDEYKKMENEFGQIIVKKEKQSIKGDSEKNFDSRNEKRYDSSYKKEYVKKEEFKSDPDNSESRANYDDKKAERRKIKEQVYEDEDRRVNYKTRNTEPSCSYRHSDHNRQDSRSKNYRNKEDADSHISRRHRSRSPVHVKSKSKSTSSCNRKHTSGTESSDSSDSSESDPSHKRKHKKSSKMKSKPKSIKSKDKRRDKHSGSDILDTERHKKRNHKKTKKSKKDRARSRSRERR